MYPIARVGRGIALLARIASYKDQRAKAATASGAARDAGANLRPGSADASSDARKGKERKRDARTTRMAAQTGAMKKKQRNRQRPLPTNGRALCHSAEQTAKRPTEKGKGHVHSRSQRSAPLPQRRVEILFLPRTFFHLSCTFRPRQKCPCRGQTKKKREKAGLCYGDAQKR